MDASTWRWWTALRAASSLNLVLLTLTALAGPLDPPRARLQFGLAAIYTAVCAFRSFFPRVDLERTVLLDHWLSSIALGRSAATIAELAFTVQCAVFAQGLAEASCSRIAAAVAVALVPVIAVAQVSCWLGVVTLRHVWHAGEEALWAVAMAMLAASFVDAWPEVDATTRASLALGCVACAAGAYVMVVLDLPMYLRRYRAELAAGRTFLALPEGLADAVRRREPTGSWDVWRREVAWMTPYFTGGVWLSLALVWFEPR